ncbi:MAG: carboxymuconolactone decarboxylase family protein [Thermodesulfobacteriota bacterium]|nr:carboxymuconolactone decarboxylase family protein [Thermodesulfobacteriota bacterium]
MRLSTPRIPPASPEEMDEEAMSLLGLLSAKSGRADNIFATLARHPVFLKNFLVFGSHVLMTSTLPPREREILILRIGWLCKSEYEWGQHVEIGRRSGLSDEDILRITAGADAPGWSELEAALIRAADELHGDAFIQDATWHILSRHFDTRQLIDLVFTVGQYNMVSMALNTFGVQLDDRLSGFPETP